MVLWGACRIGGLTWTSVGGVQEDPPLGMFFFMKKLYFYALWQLFYIQNTCQDTCLSHWKIETCTSKHVVYFPNKLWIMMFTSPSSHTHTHTNRVSLETYIYFDRPSCYEDLHTLRFFAFLVLRFSMLISTKHKVQLRLMGLFGRYLVIAEPGNYHGEKNKLCRLGHINHFCAWFSKIYHLHAVRLILTTYYGFIFDLEICRYTSEFWLFTITRHWSAS